MGGCQGGALPCSGRLSLRPDFLIFRRIVIPQPVDAGALEAYSPETAHNRNDDRGGPEPTARPDFQPEFSCDTFRISVFPNDVSIRGYHLKRRRTGIAEPSGMEW